MNRPNTETPRFADAPCPFQADEKLLASLRCGYLMVPENRSRPDGRQLRIAVAIARSVSANPRPDPVVVVGGGPGSPSVQSVPRQPLALRADRDVIFWEQRGTGYSDPAFCPDLNARWNRIFEVGLAGPERLAQQRQAVAECRDAMLRDGVDLSQYNTWSVPTISTICGGRSA